MSTRSLIGVRNLDSTVDYIYCHFDGYPKHNGHILVNYYSNIDKVWELLELGDLSKLGIKIGEKQDFNDFDSYNKDWCLVYGRDRGEKDRGMRRGNYLDVIKDQDVDFVYIFDGDYWECFDTSEPEDTIDLYR